MTGRPLRFACCCVVFVLGLESPATGASNRELLNNLVKAYPEKLSGHDDTYVYWRDGTSMPVDDNIPEKTFDQLLTQSSILDQFRIPYPTGRLTQAPARDVDPGRFRNERFFSKMYGDCRAGEVSPNLVSITWLPRSWGHTIAVTRINEVSERLKIVSSEIEGLPPEIRKAAYPIAGVLSCRPVRDTGRLSMHAYAAAIDLNLSFSDYWLWQRGAPAATLTYRNRMPQEIVDVFERHGFIWGGKWYHYDTMHFEYRPELLKVSGRR